MFDNRLAPLKALSVVSFNCAPLPTVCGREHCVPQPPRSAERLFCNLIRLRPSPHSLRVRTSCLKAASLRRARFLELGSTAPLSTQSAGADIVFDNRLAPQSAFSTILRSSPPNLRGCGHCIRQPQPHPQPQGRWKYATDRRSPSRSHKGGGSTPRIVTAPATATRAVEVRRGSSQPQPQGRWKYATDRHRPSHSHKGGVSTPRIVTAPATVTRAVEVRHGSSQP